MTMFGPISPEKIAERVTAMVMTEMPMTHEEIFKARKRDIANALGKATINQTLESIPGANVEDEDYSSQLGETQDD